jgi:membrane-associated phospholipid phosphatase
VVSATTTDVRTDVPRTDQRVLLGIAVGCLAVFVLLAVLVWHVEGPIGLDDAIAAIGTSSGQLLRRLAFLGSLQFVITALIATAIVAYALRDYAGVAICAVGPALAGVVGLVAKHVIDRSIAAALGYPSGHATMAAALAAVIVVIAYRVGGAWAAAFLAVAAAVIPVLVSVAVVRIGWHYPTDVIGGIALGVGVVFGTAAVFTGARQRA